MIYPSKKDQRPSKGFTLLELLIVIAVIGLLASIMVVGFSGAQKRARIAQGWQFSDSLRGALQADMVAWWSFDETSGNTAKDSWFNGLHGTVYGAQWTEGIVNNALEFDGNDWVNCGNDSSLNPSTEVTLEAWVKNTNITPRQGIVVRWYRHPFGLLNWGNGYLRWGYTLSDGDFDYQGLDYTIPQDTWLHLAVTHKSLTGEIILYVNGKSYIRTALHTGNFEQTSAELYIGASDANLVPFNGLIDEVRIYEAALPQAAIQQHYAEGLKRHQDLVKK